MYYNHMITALHDRIVTDSTILLGKPIIQGTRISVELVLRQLGHGITINELLKNYPHLTQQDIQAAIDYAAQVIESEKVYSLDQIHGADLTQAFA